MNFEDSLEAPLARGEHSRLADLAAARGRLRPRIRNEPPIGPCSVALFPNERIAGLSPPVEDRTSGSDIPSGKESRWRGEVVLLVPALSAVLCGWPHHAQEPTDVQLIAVVRQYGAALPRRIDPVTGRAVRIERTPREWVVTLIDPRRLDTPRHRYIDGARSAYHIDRGTLRVVAVVVAKQNHGPADVVARSGRENVAFRETRPAGPSPRRGRT
jgi:hypothetical protein